MHTSNWECYNRTDVQYIADISLDIANDTLFMKPTVKPHRSDLLRKASNAQFIILVLLEAFRHDYHLLLAQLTQMFFGVQVVFRFYSNASKFRGY